MVTVRALAVLFFTELAIVTVSPTVALSGSVPSEAAEARTVSCGFWLPTAVVAWAMGMARSSASAAKVTRRPILTLVIIRSLPALLLAALLAPEHPCKDIRVEASASSTEHGNGCRHTFPKVG